ncbi:tyrosine-type recombinase/integrase [Dethiobacter alkaliphilus]|uniref:Integrase family protein n=1 Tax=Dethiobacter alkaliphilus AHT 1 TaxID=555088 RepID=C0GE82_DETAL|nr:tyrosine-type recombinase/integrase [Dethiobacter alkaliphilus]EEG78376.1 integrase family protein [Dethiobacter alkaliphilus AHT 1]
MQTVKYFTQDELASLFKAIKKKKSKYWLRDYCIFRVAYRCALRASEVGLLTVAEYNAQRSELYCNRLKNSQNNTIRLDDETKKALEKYIRDYGIDDCLFPSQVSKPISRQTLDLLMRKYCKVAKISDKKKWHFHSLKHSVAVHLADSGLDVKELQHYLGHKNVNSTLVYFQFTTRQQDNMYKKLEQRNYLV